MTDWNERTRMGWSMEQGTRAQGRRQREQADKPAGPSAFSDQTMLCGAVCGVRCAVCGVLLLPACLRACKWNCSSECANVR